MENLPRFDLEKNVRKCERGWFVRCPYSDDYGFIPAEVCHNCYIDAMALNNREHKGYNCKEGLFYRFQRSEGNII